MLELSVLDAKWSLAQKWTSPRDETDYCKCKSTPHSNRSEDRWRAEINGCNFDDANTGAGELDARSTGVTKPMHPELNRVPVIFDGRSGCRLEGSAGSRHSECSVQVVVYAQCASTINRKPHHDNDTTRFGIW